MRIGVATLLGAMFVGAAPASPAAAQRSPAPNEGDIVVTGERMPGAVAGTIAPETSLDSGAIAALGASTLADLVNQLSAQTSGAQGRAGDAPVLLLNGRRISSFSEVRDLPPEAVRRVDILPEEAAIRYGFPAHQKLINIVLLRRFAAVTGELEPRLAPAIGRGDLNTELNAVRIDGDNRMTLDLQYQMGDAIRESTRGVVRGAGPSTASFAGILRSAANGASIDSALDLLAGRRVTNLTLPQALAGNLADFARAAALPVSDDSGATRTVLPATRQFTANGVFARTLGKALALTVNGRFDRLTSDALLGPASVSLPVPAGNPYSPFAAAVRVDRYLDRASAIRRETAVDTIHLGAILSGAAARWTWSATVNHDLALTHMTTSGGVDGSGFAALVRAGAPGTNPFAALDPAAFPLLGARMTRGRISMLTGDIVASGPLFALPAGDATLSLRASAAVERSSARDESGTTGRLTRDLRGGQAAVDLPVTTRRSAIGALAVGASAFLRDYSDAGTIIDHGWTLSWSPRPPLSIVVAGNRESAVATAAQRGDAVSVTSGVAYLDFGSARDVTATRISGGFAGLRPDLRHLFKIEATLKPIRNGAIIATYSDLRTDHPIAVFPGVTPAFEAAFPDRIVRGGDGTITTIDVRPVNLASERRCELRWGLNISRDFGARSAGPRVPGGGGFGGGHYFGARGSTLQVSLYHSWRLADSVVLAPGAAPIDLLGGNRLGDTLIVPRHTIDLQLSATHAGFGLRSSVSWASASDIGAGTPGALRVAPPLTFNVRLFAFSAQHAALLARWPWLKGVRILAAFDNILDSYSRVSDRFGTTPLAYQRGYRDPLGRTIRLSIRKTLE